MLPSENNGRFLMGFQTHFGWEDGPLSDGDVALGRNTNSTTFYHLGLSPLGAGLRVRKTAESFVMKWRQMSSLQAMMNGGKQKRKGK
jgi:hypothetical protein